MVLQPCQLYPSIPASPSRVVAYFCFVFCFCFFFPPLSLICSFRHYFSSVPSLPTPFSFPNTVIFHFFLLSEVIFLQSQLYYFLLFSPLLPFFLFLFSIFFIPSPFFCFLLLLFCFLFLFLLPFPFSHMFPPLLFQFSFFPFFLHFPSEYNDFSLLSPLCSPLFPVSAAFLSHFYPFSVILPFFCFLFSLFYYAFLLLFYFTVFFQFLFHFFLLSVVHFSQFLLLSFFTSPFSN